VLTFLHTRNARPQGLDCRWLYGKSFLDNAAPPVLRRRKKNDVFRAQAAVARAIKDLDAEKMLRYVWVVQQKRVEEMVAEEESTGIFFPRGYKNISALTDIAKAIMLHEFGIKLMKQKGCWYPRSEKCRRPK
jgi:hypothetical protein